MSVHLVPLPPGADTEPGCIDWRVGPGLVRTAAPVDPACAPEPLKALFDDGTLESADVRPGRIRTRLAAGRSPARDGVRVRSAIFAVLSGPDGWPGPEQVSDDDAGNTAADAEIAAAVTEVLHGEFGAYTAGHGGRIDLIGVHDGVVTVAMGGACKGCSAAGHTLAGNLAQRLTRIPGYRDLLTADDHSPTRLPFPTLRRRRRSSS